MFGNTDYWVISLGIQHWTFGHWQKNLKLNAFEGHFNLFWNGMLATSKKRENFDFQNWILKTKFIISFAKIILLKYPRYFLSKCTFFIIESRYNFVCRSWSKIKIKHKSKRKLWTSSHLGKIPSNFVSPCWNFSTHLTLILMIVRGQGFCLPGHHSNEIDT